MTIEEQQEDIREGLVEALSEERCLTCAHMDDEGYTCAHCGADVALQYLTEMGAVLKVEGRDYHCPTCNERHHLPPGLTATAPLMGKK